MKTGSKVTQNLARSDDMLPIELDILLAGLVLLARVSKLPE